MNALFLVADILLRAAMFLSGAADAESVDQGLLDRLEIVQRNPLRLNRDSRTRLLSGGLLSQYQLASLEDYRRSSGDVLSLSELALVDGFGAEWVEVMAPFISLESSLRPGERDTLVWRHNVLVNTDLKAVRGKYKFNAGGVTAGIAGRLSYDGIRTGDNLGSYTFHFEWCLPRWRIIAGDFNTRFGQGLAMWTGFRLSGLQTVDAFMLRPGGIVPSWSVSGDGLQRGLAVQWTPGNWQISAFGSPGSGFKLSEGVFGLHGERWFLNGECGGGVFRTPEGWKAAVDGRWHIGRMTLFGEGALSARTEGVARLAFAGLIGCRISVFESDKMAFQIRALPSRYSGKKNGEYAAAAGYAWKQASLTGEFSLLPLPGKDNSRKQLKVYGLWTIPFGSGWSLKLRGYERWRSYDKNRLDLRGDLAWEKGFWTVRGRVNAVICMAYGLLGYLEGGFKDEAWTVWLRGEIFHVDNWDDRIYVYEHDAPGNFSVPACYGRGGAMSAYAGWKKRLGGRASGSGRGGRAGGSSEGSGMGNADGTVASRKRQITLRLYFRAYGMFRAGRDFSPALRLQTQMEF